MSSRFSWPITYKITGAVCLLFQYTLLNVTAALLGMFT